MPPPSSSFTVRRANKSTFLIVERDLYGEHPFIYAKIHPKAPIIVLGDTGCDEPAEEVRKADITHLRPFLETYPVPENDQAAINPGGLRTYVIILSHCHYDHICGITQFLAGGRTQIIASAAGRDFIESDLGAHSLCDHGKIPVPYFNVTHWAQSNEHLTWPLAKSLPGDNAAVVVSRQKRIELGITMLHTPGHTPDALSWYDHEEGTVYIGDSFYRMGADKMPIIYPPQGSLIDAVYSLRKIEEYVSARNHQLELEDITDSDLADWVQLKAETRLSAAHQTCEVPAKTFISQASSFYNRIVTRQQKVLHSVERFGEVHDYYLDDLRDGKADDRMSLFIPRRLVEEYVAHHGGSC